MNEMTMQRTPEMIAGEINMIKAQARETYVRSAIEIGRRLYEAKAMVPYGKWGEWLEKNVDYSDRTAQNLIAVYEEYGRNGDSQAIANLSFTQAVLLLRLDGESRAELLETKDVPGMSTRELQAEIERVNAEIEKRQITIDQLMSADKEMDEQLKQEQAAAQAAREDMLRARTEAETSRTQAADAVARANAVSAENTQLRAALEEEKKRTAPIIEQVEVVPPEVERELNELRAKAAEEMPEVVRLKYAYEELVSRFQSISTMLGDLEKKAPEEAARYRRAVATAAQRMAERIGQA